MEERPHSPSEPDAPPGGWAPNAWARLLAERAPDATADIDTTRGRPRIVRRVRRTLRPVRALARKAQYKAEALRRVARPAAPPALAPDRVAFLSAAPADTGFITGNGLAARCRYVLNYETTVAVDESVDNNWWFCKADFLEYFFRELAPDSPFVLLSHNSDRSIGRRFAWHLERRNLVAWFACNAELAHPKLFALPIGIANPRWPHGDVGAIRAVQRARPFKSRLFDVSFTPHTHPRERARCLAETGLSLQLPCAFEEYLERLASAYFSICPRGVGIDTLRVWESLYLGTIPVVTRSVLTDLHPDLPLIVLDDWSRFRSLEFTPESYAHICGDWDPAEISLDGYVARIARIAEALTGGRAATPPRPIRAFRPGAYPSRPR